VAQAVEARLAKLELPPGSLVGLAAANGVAFLAGFLAVRRQACCALLLDGHAPEKEKLHIADRLGAAALLACPTAWPQDDADLTLTRLPGRPVLVSPEMAVVKLTSGSTGDPRGILTPSQALVADDKALTATMGLAADERILAAIPMSHSYGLSSIVLPALLRDAVLVVPKEGHLLAPMLALRACQATFLPTVPAYLAALVKMSTPPPAPDSLRRVISAGALLDSATAIRFREIYGQNVHVFYGSSESGGISYDRIGTAGARGTLGLPVEGVEVTLAPFSGNGAAASKNGAASGSGTVTVTSPAVAAAYLDETGPNFDEPSLGRGRFSTRDLAIFREGEIVLEGRLDDLINVKGKKVNPREVERVLAQLEGVDEVVTLGVSRPGQAGEMVRSFVACRPGRLSYEGVQAWCRGHLAKHKVPRSIVLLEKIPKTSRGKLDRSALLALAPDALQE
jgi:long-chain acyl-CoA synthetase